MEERKKLRATNTNLVYVYVSLTVCIYGSVRSRTLSIFDMCALLLALVCVCLYKRCACIRFSLKIVWEVGDPVKTTSQRTTKRARINAFNSLRLLLDFFFLFFSLTSLLVVCAVKLPSSYSSSFIQKKKKIIIHNKMVYALLVQFQCTNKLCM